MSSMVNVLDIFYSLIQAFKKCVPKSKHYLGYLPENFRTPSFLYLIVFNGDTRTSHFVKDVVVDLQIVCFTDDNGYPSSKLENQLKMMDQLKVFLSQFNLSVQDRNLKFDYTFSTSDDQLTVNVQFKFKDGVIDLEYTEEQARDMIETIYINEKEVV